MTGLHAPLDSGRLGFVLASLLAAAGVTVWLLIGVAAVGGSIGGVGFGLDAMSGFFLLWWLVEQVGLAVRSGRWFAASGGLIAFAAVDAMGLLAGLALAALGRRRGGFAVVLVLAGLALLGGGSFEATRGAGVEGVGLAGLVAVSVAGAVLIGGPLGTYVLARTLLDLAGPVSGWAGGEAMLLGAGVAAFGGWFAWRGVRMGAVMDGVRWMLAGFGAMGAGVVMAGQAIDFAGPVMLGFGVVWLSAVVAATSVPVLGALGRLAGGMLGARIGGLGCLAAAVGAALVPPGAGFAMLWQMLRAVQTLPVMPVVGALAALGACAAAGFAAAAMLRVLRVGFGAGAGEVDPGGLTRGVMVGLGGLGLLAGVFPGGVIVLAGGVSEIGYAPGLMGGGLALLGGITAILARRISGGGYRVISAAEPAPVVAPPGLGVGLRRVAGLRAWARRAVAGVDGLALPVVAGGVLVLLAALLVAG